MSEDKKAIDLEMLGTNILVAEREGQEEAEISKGGIVMVGGGDTTSLAKFEVVGVGPGGFRQDGKFQKIEDISLGDWVLVDKGVMNPVRSGGRNCFVVAYRDVVAKVKNG